jgi:LysM domain-containing protein
MTSTALDIRPRDMRARAIRARDMRARDVRTATRRVSTPDPRRVATTRPTTAPRRTAATRPTAVATASTPVLRLTRRGRLVVLLTVLLAVAAVAMRGAPAASTDVAHHQRTTTVVVSPGETVWDIARRVAPEADIRATVAEIDELNSLADAGSIRVGQALTVPVG